MASTILFPTDFSKPANNALGFMLPFAEKLEASIILMHAYTIPTPIAEAPFYAWEEELRRTEAQVIHQLELLKESILVDHPHLSIETHAAMGFPVPSILVSAEEFNVDWIMMGTKGATGLKKIFLGSVAAQVIGRAKLPVLAIPDEKLLAEIHRIIYATNYEMQEIEALDRICKLAKHFEAEVLVAHVFTGEGSPPVERWEFFERAVKSKIDYPKLSFKFVAHYDFREALEELIGYTGAEVLAMCPHRKGFFERLALPSKTKAMAYQTHTPLLSIPEA